MEASFIYQLCFFNKGCGLLGGCNNREGAFFSIYLPSSRSQSIILSARVKDVPSVLQTLNPSALMFFHFSFTTKLWGN